MRNAFIKTLELEASKNKNIILLTGDLGFTVFEKFRERFPNRFFNMGVAEANMMGVAAGLALCGKIPFVYSIVPFVTMRPFEQIRNDVCLHKANVKIVGVGGGFAYSHAGTTHHAIEDIAIMRALPNMTVICPADPLETELASRAIIKFKSPVYLRLGKKGEPKIHKTEPKFSIGKGIVIKKGKDIALVACGPITQNCLLAVNELERKGISATVVSMHTVKPLDIQLLDEIIIEHKALFVIEEHNIIGGLGSAVAEYLAENQETRIFFKRIGVNDQYCFDIGNYEYIRDIFNLSPHKISQTIQKYLKKYGI